MIVSALGILALVALLGWVLGGIVLRLVGLLLALAGLLGVVVAGDASGVLVFVIGALVWLAGHWHYALRHQKYKSPLARHLFCRWLPAALDPTRRWTSPVVDERPTAMPPRLGRRALGPRGASNDGPQVASVKAQDFSAPRLEPAFLLTLPSAGSSGSGEEWLAIDGRRTTKGGDVHI